MEMRNMRMKQRRISTRHVSGQRAAKAWLEGTL
jgi:hypothetical protein